MLPVGKITKEEDVDFSWGEKMMIGGVNKDVIFYKSFKYDGVAYSLYDSVYVWSGDDPEPSIGKIVKMWETSTHKNKVKIVWYFRPCEVKNFWRDVEPLEKEIFLACGEGKGLFNIITPEVISGKCKVICTAPGRRNPQVSREELQMADYIFFRTFDVENCNLSERFPDEIAGLKVVHYFNMEKDRNFRSGELEEKKRKITVHLKGVPVAVGNSIKDEVKIEEASLGKRTCSGMENDFDRPTKPFGEVCPGKSPFSCKDTEGTTGFRPMKRKKVHFNADPVAEYVEPHKSLPFYEMEKKLTEIYADGEEQGRESKTCSKPFVVTRRPDEEANKWFKQQPWEVKMQRAHEIDALILLENLHPSYTSSEVEDIVWSALNKKVDAKMIQRCVTSRYHYGKALVVFKSKDAAEAAISELFEKCLVLTDGRPIVASRGYPKNFKDKNKFYGHLIIDKLRYHKQQDQMSRGLSTSHYSQPNTIEYELALEWCALQERSTSWWNALGEQQGKEIEELKSKG